MVLKLGLGTAMMPRHGGQNVSAGRIVDDVKQKRAIDVKRFT